MAVDATHGMTLDELLGEINELVGPIEPRILRAAEPEIPFPGEVHPDLIEIGCTPQQLADLVTSGCQSGVIHFAVPQNWPEEVEVRLRRAQRGATWWWYGVDQYGRTVAEPDYRLVPSLV